jgi:hypothetical protein
MGGNGNGDPLDQLAAAAAAGAVELGAAEAVAVRRQVIVSPLQTEAVMVAGGQLEVSFLDTEGGEPVARTFRIGGPGIGALRAALELEEPAAPPTPAGGSDAGS